MAKVKMFKASQLAILCYQMSLIHHAGLSLIEGMHLISDEIDDKELEEALDSIREDLRSSMKLHEAMERNGKFPPYMYKMIKIGEASGSLDETLESLSNYYENIYSMNKRIQSDVAYPFILIGLMMVIIAILFIRIIPMFKQILESIGGDMPLITSYVFSISEILKASGLFVLLAVLLSMLAFLSYRRTMKGSVKVDQLKVKLPIIKHVYIRLYAARFSETMALLIKSGISYAESLNMAASVVNNVILEERIHIYQSNVVKGTIDEDAFKAIGIFPNLMIRMVNIGYQTGELVSVMERLSHIYKTELNRELNRMTAIVEPILIIILSLIIGVILLTVMLPLISIMSAIGN